MYKVGEVGTLMTKKKSVTIIALSTMLIVAITTAVSYAYWSVTKTQTTKNVVKAGCFDISITNDTDAINLQKAYPISDEAGAKLAPYKFTVTNTCNIYASYVVNLEVLGSTTLSREYIAVKVDNKAKAILGGTDGLPTATPTISGALESRHIAQGELGQGESKTYNLRLWMDKDTPLNNDTQNKKFEAKVVVVSEAIETPQKEEPGLYAADGTTYTWEELKASGIITVNNGFFLVENNRKDELVGKLVLDEEVTRIQNYAFNECSGLTEVKIPNSVISIGESAFEECENLTSVTIPDSVTSIGSYAFDGTAITSIEIPDSVTSIGNNAFFGCSLTNIKIDENNPVYDSRENSNALIETSTNTLIKGSSNAIIPEGVTSIGYGAFVGIEITSIEIPDGVTSIGESAFEGTGITSIEIPNSVTRIANGAFHNCENLISATFVNPNGWQVVGRELSSTELSNPSTAATNLSKFYSQVVWTRS